jgi:UDP-3-O-[3-hydroxymyristoyl] glucosamine N-acyltransferase
MGEIFMAINIEEVVDLLKSKFERVCLIRNSKKSIKCASSINHQRDDSIVFVTQQKWEENNLNLNKVSCVITNSECLDKVSNCEGCFSIIKVERPRLAFLYILEHFFKKASSTGIHRTAQIEAGAEIASNVTIGAFTFIGNDCHVGEGTVISSGCTIEGSTRIGKNCFIGPGVKIGQQGYGYERLEDGSLLQVPHIGGVTIGNEVHIGANTAIDRGTIDDTIIFDRVRIDNLCHISHNVILEEDCAIVANCMIGGSVRIGRGSWIAPSCSVRDKVSITAGVKVGIGSVVSKPITDIGVYVGSPAQTLESFKQDRKKFKSSMSLKD